MSTTFADSLVVNTSNCKFFLAYLIFSKTPNNNSLIVITGRSTYKTITWKERDVGWVVQRIQLIETTEWFGTETEQLCLCIFLFYFIFIIIGHGQIWHCWPKYLAKLFCKWVERTIRKAILEKLINLILFFLWNLEPIKILSMHFNE